MVLMIILIPSLLFAAEPFQGFIDVPFGANYDKAMEIFKTNHPDIKAIASTRNEIIKIANFSLGSIEYGTYLYFDNGIFYSFEFGSDFYSANELYSSVYDNLEYITDVFKNKYGKAECKKSKPLSIQISEGSPGTYCLWELRNIVAVTGILENDSRFKAFGKIFDKKLLNQITDKEKSIKTKNAKDGANQF